MKTNLNQFIKIALLSAIAVILMYLEFPIPFLPTWLKIDLSDVPAFMGAFAFGPLVGISIEIIKNILILLVKGTQSGFVGELANIVIGISLIAPAAFIYKQKRSKNIAIIGMILGSIIMTVIAVVANIYVFLPLYNINMGTSELVSYVTFGLIPFNIIKSILVCVITYLSYKRLSFILFKDDMKFSENKKINSI